MMAINEDPVDGALQDQFGRCIDISPASTPPRCKPKRQPKWLGAGRCRACARHLTLYQSPGQWFAWADNTKALAPACPGCGLALTTTTTELVPQYEGPPRGYAGSVDGVRTIAHRPYPTGRCCCGCNTPGTYTAFGEGIALFDGCEELIRWWYRDPYTAAQTVTAAHCHHLEIAS